MVYFLLNTLCTLNTLPPPLSYTQVASIWYSPTKLVFISVLVSLEDTSLRKKGKGLMFQQTLCFGSLPWRRMNQPGLSRCYQLLKLHSNYRRILCDPILKVFRVLISHYFHHPRPISDKREYTLEFLCVIQSDLACLQGEIKIIKCIPWTIL